MHMDFNVISKTQITMVHYKYKKNIVEIIKGKQQYRKVTLLSTQDDTELSLKTDLIENGRVCLIVAYFTYKITLEP